MKGFQQNSRIPVACPHAGRCGAWWWTQATCGLCTLRALGAGFCDCGVASHLGLWNVRARAQAGALPGGGRGQRVVCDWVGGPHHQDLGPGNGAAEADADGAHRAGARLPVSRACLARVWGVVLWLRPGDPCTDGDARIMTSSIAGHPAVLEACWPHTAAHASTALPEGSLVAAMPPSVGLLVCMLIFLVFG